MHKITFSAVVWTFLSGVAFAEAVEVTQFNSGAAAKPGKLVSVTEAALPASMPTQFGSELSAAIASAGDNTRSQIIDPSRQFHVSVVAQSASKTITLRRVVSPSILGQWTLPNSSPAGAENEVIGQILATVGYRPADGRGKSSVGLEASKQ